MEGVPFPPQLTGRVQGDFERIMQHFYALNKFLAEDTPDTGWVVDVAYPAKFLDDNSSLAEVRNVLASLIQLLTQRGFLSG